MFGKAFQRRYALTDQGVKNTKKGAFWTVIVNLVVMGGMGILYLMMTKYMWSEMTAPQGNEAFRMKIISQILKLS